MTAASPTDLQSRIGLESMFVLFGVSIAAVSPYLPLLLRERGLGPDQIGLVLGAIAAAGLLTTSAIGHVADTRLGRARTLRIVAATSAIAALGFAVAGESLALLLAAAVLFGAPSQALNPLLDAVALDELERRRRGDYGRVRSWASLSFAGGAVGLAWVLERTSLELLIVALVGPLLAFLIPLRRWPSPPPPPSTDRRAGFLTTITALARLSPRFPMFLASVLLVNMALVAGFGFLPLRMDDVGSGLVLIGLGVAVAALLEVPIMRVTGRLVRRRGTRAVYLGGCGGYVLCLAALGATDDARILSVLWAASGFAYALLHVGSVMLVAELVPVTARGLGQGTLQTIANGIAPILGLWAGGIVYARLGSTTLFVASSGLAAGAAVLAWWALATRALDAEQPPGPHLR